MLTSITGRAQPNAGTRRCARYGLAVWIALQVLPAASLRLTSPAGGERWAVGSGHYVTWQSQGLPDETMVEASYSIDAGRTWRQIGETNASSSRILWKIPRVVSNRCRVRLAAREAHVGDANPVEIVASQQRSYHWTNVMMNAAFAPRDGAGALVFGGRMWLIGGWNPGDRRHFPRVCSNDVWSSADGADWALVKPNSFLDSSFDPKKDWEGRHTAGYVVFLNRMWIVGGDPIQRHYQPNVWSSADGKTWDLEADGNQLPWAVRALHHTLVFKGKIWVMGGQTMPAFARADEVFYRDIWNSSDGARWVKVNPREPYWKARGMIGGGAIFKGRIWILGGGTYNTPTTPARSFYADVWSSPDGVAWTRHVECAPWEPRQYHDVAVFDGRLWVLEGYAQPGGNRRDVWYSQDGVNWYEVPDTPWKPRHAASLFVHENALWIAAGNNMESDVWKLEPISSGTTPGSAGGWPAPK